MTRANTTDGERRRDSKRLCLLTLGVILIVLSPVVGALPGPGGLLLLIAGLALTLKNSRAAKRLYVRIKRRWPGLGHWTDKGLRRPSHFRRLRRNEESPPVGN
jgi:hypothetical protein